MQDFGEVNFSNKKTKKPYFNVVWHNKITCIPGHGEIPAAKPLGLGCRGLRDLPVGALS